MQRHHAVATLVFVTSSLLVLSTSGQFPLDQLHHTAHLLFPTLAFAVFAVYVARDVRKHGWPAFSWRLDP